MDNNTKDIFGAIYCLMNLVTLEAGDKEVLVDMVHFCLKIQVSFHQEERKRHIRCPVV